MSNNPLNMSCVDWFNFFGEFASIFSGVLSYNMITSNECAMLHPTEPTANDMNVTTFKHDPATLLVSVTKQNPHAFPVHSVISKFMLLCAVKFKHDHGAAISYIQYELIMEPIPYIRVGTDYFKIISKIDRYGSPREKIKSWKKDEIKQDHSKTLLQAIPKFDDFVLMPDNKNYKPTHNNCYNLYAKFSHTPHAEPVTLEDIPATAQLIQHIFGEHFDIAMGVYLKCLYEYPRQILPVLALVSKERDTGKTTFINWFDMLFGDNSILISPDDVVKNFNASYATKNIVMIDETVVEKQAGVEKLKSMSTAKSITVHQKHVSEYSIPSFIKIILCTNKVKDFMRIDSEEIRFWVRKVLPISGKKNTKIEDDLFSEIPKFLRYIVDLPEIDFDTGSRMVLTQEQINTNALDEVKDESRSWLYKEIELLVSDFFDTHPAINQFHASAKDVKDEWFKTNNQISIAYIRKVLYDEAEMQIQTSETGKAIRYYRFADFTNQYAYKSGTPFLFTRQSEVIQEPLLFSH